MTKNDHHDELAGDPIDAELQLQSQTEPEMYNAFDEEFTAPSIGDDDDYAYQRCQRTAAALHLLSLENVEFIASGQRNPQELMFDRLEETLQIVAEEPTIAWPQSTWLCLEEICKLAKLVSEYGDLWRDARSEWDHAIGRAIQLAEAERPQLLDPSDPEPRTVELETLEELVEQKVSNAQIARIYNWVDEHGNADISKVKLAKRGDIKTPERFTFPPLLRGPKRQPHLGPIDTCIGIFNRQHQEDPIEA